MSESYTDSQLLKRYVCDGADDAFAIVVQRHMPMVYGVALRRTADSALAGEVAQQVFILLAKRAVWLASHPSLGGWLHRTAVHLAQHEQRGEIRRRQREGTAIQIGACMKSDESILSTIMPVLDEVLLELRDADREVLVLRYFGDKSLREVGAALGITEDTAQKRVARALDALTERFRRRGFALAGAAVVALALQPSPAHAVPAGLAAGTAKAALAVGGAHTFGHFTIPIIKYMSLTKLQTAALCLTLAGLPLGYQLHSLVRARKESSQLNSKLSALRLEILKNEHASARTAGKIASLEAQALRNSTVNKTSKAPAPKLDIYAWDENSPYVRLPKSVMAKIRFAPFAERIGQDGKTNRYQLPPLEGDGSPRPALEAALGLSDDEAKQLRELCQNEFKQFQQLAASHSQITEGTFANGSKPTVTMDTAAFADEGAQVRDQYQAQVAALIGQDRAEAFWEQATPMFQDLFNDFGANGRKLMLIDNPAGLELMNSDSRGSTIGSLSQLNGMPLPPQLQAYADTWAAQQNNPSPAKQP